MDFIYQQAQENFTVIMKELVEKPDFGAFVKAQSKEDFVDTFWGLMKVYSKYQEYLKPQEKIPHVDTAEVAKMVEKIFVKIGSGEVVPGDIMNVMSGNCSEEKMIELGKKLAGFFEEGESREVESEEEEVEESDSDSSDSEEEGEGDEGKAES